MNFRIERINSGMQRSIMEIISNKVRDPRVSQMVSVTKVDCAKDLKTAKIYVSVFGEGEKINETMDAIKASSGFIRHCLSEDFKDIRTVPQLTFIQDMAGEYSKNIETLLAKLHKKD